MFLLIRTTEAEPPVARYVQSEARAWDIIREEIRLAANDAGITDAEEIEEHVTEYPNAAVIELWDDAAVYWDIINANDIETVE